MKDLSTIYDDIGDLLEYGNITDDEAIKLCNEIIHKSILESDERVLEAMYHAILTGVTNRKIGDKLHANIIVTNMNKFGEEVLDYIITILAYTGNKEYAEIIQQTGQKYEILDVEDPNLIRKFIGGDTDFDEISEMEAKELVKQRFTRGKRLCE